MNRLRRRMSLVASEGRSLWVPALGGIYRRPEVTAEPILILDVIHRQWVCIRWVLQAMALCVHAHGRRNTEEYVLFCCRLGVSNS